MCIGMKTPAAPPPPPMTPEAAQTPAQAASPVQARATDDKRRRASMGTGRYSTILTSSRGVSNGAAIESKSLLGQ